MLFQISNQWCHTFFLSKIDTPQIVLEQCAYQIDRFGAPRKVCVSQGASVAHTRQTSLSLFYKIDETKTRDITFEKTYHKRLGALIQKCGLKNSTAFVHLF